MSETTAPAVDGALPDPARRSDTTVSRSAAEPELDPKRWLALAVIGVTQLMIVLDASIVNIALPSAQRDLGITQGDLQWVLTAYTLAFGGLLLLGGRIADFAGRKRALIVGLLGFAGASAIGGIAPNAMTLFLARGLQGVFGAVMAPAALALITVTFTKPDERAKAFGVFGAIAGGGAAIGLILGGVLTQYFSWRWCLGVNVPIALVTAVAAAAILRESRAHGDTRYDVPGAVLATAGLVSLVYGFTEASKDGVGWTAGSTIGFLAAAVVLLAAFIGWELRSANPLLPMRILLDRNRGGSYLVFFFLGAGMFAMFLFLTFYFQRNLEYSPLKSGFAFLPFSLGIILTAGVAAQLLPRVGPKPLMLVGLVMAIVGMVGLTQLDAESSYAGWVLPIMIILSVGMALVFIPASSTALVGIGDHDAGVASAVLNTSQQIGGSLGTALLNTLFASAVTGFITDRVATMPPPDPNADPSVVQQAMAQLEDLAFLHGYRVAFFWGGVMFVAALIAAALLIKARKEDLPTEGAVVA